MKEVYQKAALMNQLLLKHVQAMKAGDAATARDAAYEMVQVLNGLYTAAYVAALEQARREGKLG